jgi:hypothetical protein
VQQDFRLGQLAAQSSDSIIGNLRETHVNQDGRVQAFEM